MFETICTFIYTIIGPDSEDTITWWQMSCRAAVVFLFALILVRFGGKRVFGRFSSFDIVLSVVLGSLLSRTVTGTARFFPTLAAVAFLVLIHSILANISFRSRRIGFLIKARRDS